jgi:hypothetical protein
MSLAKPEAASCGNPAAPGVDNGARMNAWVANAMQAGVHTFMESLRNSATPGNEAQATQIALFESVTAGTVEMLQTNSGELEALGEAMARRTMQTAGYQSAVATIAAQAAAEPDAVPQVTGDAMRGILCGMREMYDEPQPAAASAPSIQLVNAASLADAAPNIPAGMVEDIMAWCNEPAPDLCDSSIDDDV